MTDEEKSERGTTLIDKMFWYWSDVAKDCYRVGKRVKHGFEYLNEGGK